MRSRLPTLAWLALRNLGREMRRAALTAAAMAIGLALLIVSRTLSDGAHEDWIDSGVRLGSGHVVFNAPGYRDSESLEDRLSEDQVEAAFAAVEGAGLPEAVLTSVRVSARGLASSPDGAIPAWILGVDPAAELPFSRLGTDVLEGRYLEERDRLHAFIGQGMALRLGLRIGSRMVLTAQAASGDIEGQLVRVVGMFRTSVPEMDDVLVHIPLGTARDWLGVEGATSVATLLPHSTFTGQVHQAAAAAVQSSGVEVTPWEEASPELYSAVRIDDAGDWAFHLILFAIVALAILNAVFMSVLHRKRELGLLRALGLSSRQTGLVVFLEGVLVTAASGVIGVALGFALVWIFFRNGLDLTGLMPEDLSFAGIVFNPVMYPVIDVRHLTQSLFFIAVIGVSASVFPAWQAAALDPAESVKVE
ncbi:MAG: FtsX-like permease family protein [Gemmatimonadota bacterium]|nr:FtsX-like permease family protein [Gemmatimonadota bacterium]MDE2865815.1 FtsX-like permease family protein [Gemmatimonadota bacterium]MYB05960.1 ABC transporter permease [Gemmatimonadota bacterium]MYG22213.1 ABC transporter permease [Gemmatimonadota bacterium]MYJ38487.1 ABC transporter permease [Gemmatimonadota bacterium]